jgi:hypothetical protein
MSSNLPYLITVFAANVILQFLIIRTSCKLLEIRRPIIYGIASYVFLLAGLSLTTTGSPNAIPRLVIGFLFLLALPVAMSSRPLHSRVLRSFIIIIGSMVPELVAQFVYSFLTGAGNYPPEASQVLTTPLIMSYIASFYMTAITFEVLILALDGSQQQIGLNLELPIIVLNALCYLVFLLLSTRMRDTRTSNPLFAMAMLAAIFATLSISLATLKIAQRDVLAAKSSADRIALARRARHVKSELSSIARHSASVRQLRHDLANQIETVDELLAQGQVGTAARHLSQLQTRARTLASQGPSQESR